MLNHEINIRVRYGETDQMKYVYYGNYAQYFEMGRVEWLRNLGLSYKKMEEFGVMLPVINMNINYLKPAKYDDLLTLKTTLTKLPGFKIDFAYELYNEADELLTKATTTLVFIDIKRNRPTKAPEYILEKINPYF
ncbi:acyl-CoA thioesterase [Aureibaculum algae]|uniref:Acyl-CoA thioesterase n=1 Tax=Aureibaculum algae TaxID=2584122 RepID=A0A5B7TTB7_9FLAO|nr:thioesterase family protein [Aureibaculum algae]QCX38227.1 acyl-CoA thioesterase [Aureibaculum algae]